MPRNVSKTPAESLAQIKADILKNNICPDLAKTATNLVMGDGSLTAEVVFIGEAPGKNEDLQGTPFVGAAGKLLDEMLDGIGHKRNQVYITNIVKFRPPNNRDPLPAEKNAFWPYLLREIATLRPKIIATLGRHSMEYFLPDEQITKVHGQPKRIKIKYPARNSGNHLVDEAQGKSDEQTEAYQEYDEGAQELLTQRFAKRTASVSSNAGKQVGSEEVVILPLYHPAAALYNSNLKQTLIDDFEKIPTIMNLIEQEKDK